MRAFYRVSLTHLWLTLTTLAAFGGIGSPVQAQNAAQYTGASILSTNTALSAAGPHSRTWQTTAAIQIASDTVTNFSSVQEIATGLNYWDGQQWQPSDTTFQIIQGGQAAQVLTTQHKVWIAANLNVTNAISVTTPDGIGLNSSILAIGLFDAVSGNTTLIGTITNCNGYLFNSNQIVFSNAFDGICANVAYTVEKGAFHQDVVFTGQLDPANWGFPTNSTRIQILTEFYNPPTPERMIRPLQVQQDSNLRATMASPDLVDQILTFGQATFGTGRAYTSYSTNSARRSGALVGKQLLTVSNRTFLIESVPFPVLQTELLALPVCQTPGRSGHAMIRGKKSFEAYAAIPEPPGQSQTIAIVRRPSELLAGLQPKRPAGVVIDYQMTISGTVTGPFQSDHTYFVSGTVYCSAPVTMEGGAVFKFPAAGGADIEVDSDLTITAQSYKPIVFTAGDDNTVGAAIDTNIWSGYTGTIQGNNYADPALFLNSGNPVALHNIRVNFAAQAVYISAYNNNYTWTVSHSQFLNCAQGIQLDYGSGAFLNVNNCLMENVQSVISDTTSSYMNSYQFCHATIDSTTNILSTDAGNSFQIPYGYFTNCVFSSASNSVTYFVGDHNGFYHSSLFGAGQHTNGAVPFQAVGAGNYYLANSTFQNLGTANIDPGLLADLSKRTTYPPLIRSNMTSTINALLVPNALRDNSGAPDFGYHYDPIDYLVDTYAFSNAVVTLSNGVAVACLNDSAGLWLRDGSSIVSVGTPLNPNWLLHYNTVQEQSVQIGSGSEDSARCVNSLRSGSVGPAGTYRFTRFVNLGGVGTHLYATGTSAYNNLWIQDCEFLSAINDFSGDGNADSIVIFNNLFERSQVSAINTSSSPSFAFSNNLVWNANVFVSAPSGGAWSAFNNNFDGCAFNRAPAINNGYNAYLNTARRLTPTNANDFVTNSSGVYDSGPLGNFYLQSSSVLINSGSANANDIGLYHYTTQTNESKEANSVVDIGYHYIALNSALLPDDTDGDGLPDYVEDINGNGIYDSGDLASWLLFDTNGDGITDYNALLLGLNPRAPKIPGLVLAWGTDTWGQTDVIYGLSNVVAVTGGQRFSLALKNDGSLVAWGSDIFTETDIPPSATNVLSVSSSFEQSIALKGDGSVISWGLTPTSTPVFTNAVAVSAGAGHLMALLNDHSFRVWGNNTRGQTNVPTLGPVIAIAAGAFHCVALEADGRITAWGTNGGASQGITNVPSSATNVVALAAGDYHTLGLRADGTVVAWGAGNPSDANSFGVFNNFGQAVVPSNATNVIAISAGGNHSMALRRDGTLVVWGDQSLPSFDSAVEGNIFSVGSGEIHCLVVCTNSLLVPPTILSTSPGNPSTNWYSSATTLTATVSSLFPFTYQWRMNGANLSGATRSSYSVMSNALSEGDYTIVATDAGGSSTSAVVGVRYYLPGMVAGWGTNNSGQLNRPFGFTNCLSLAAGYAHALAATDDGYVFAWGDNSHGQTNAPPDITNGIVVAAGYAHSLVLKSDGTIVAWGDNTYYQTNVPANATNAIAVAAGGNRGLALKRDGTVAQWGLTNGPIPTWLTNVTAIASGSNFNVALLQNSMVVAWGDNTHGQTNVPSDLTNVVMIAAGGEHSLAVKVDGTVVAWGLNNLGQTNVPSGLSNVLAVAGGDTHSVALKNDGTVVAWGDNSAGQTNVLQTVTNFPVKLITTGGCFTLAGAFSPLVQYPVDVSKDLLLIYNTNSPDSYTVISYYLTNRPMVADANVLGIGFTNIVGLGSTNLTTTTNYYETISTADITNVVFAPIQAWLSANPTKRPQFVVLFPDLPSRVALPQWNYFPVGGSYPADDQQPSLQMQISSNIVPDWRPFVTSLNMGDANDCMQYIDKIAAFGSNSSNKLLIGAYAGGYGNTNYIIDNIRDSGYLSNGNVFYGLTNGIIEHAVGAYSIIYVDNSQNIITNASDIAAYCMWGTHDGVLTDFPNYALPTGTGPKIVFGGNSGWYIMTTEESFNGRRYETDQGIFLNWFSAGAFGGTSYSNGPIGAITYVDEPDTPSVVNYFGLWAGGKVFARSAWNASTPTSSYIQVVGDPLLVK